MWGKDKRGDADNGINGREIMINDWMLRHLQYADSQVNLNPQPFSALYPKYVEIPCLFQDTVCVAGICVEEQEFAEAIRFLCLDKFIQSLQILSVLLSPANRV
jgi:hypothetical protein